ncbi:MAG TPA: hypothetical protein VGK45_12350 [Thermoanaerobaculia bacterium]
MVAQGLGGIACAAPCPRRAGHADFAAARGINLGRRFILDADFLYLLDTDP